MARYGWDRDELYFLSAAAHLALGYVDFPPLTAVVGWIVDQLVPHSLVALRAVSLAAGAATVILVAFIVRELGGGQQSADRSRALAWALTPYILGSASIFHPTWLDALAWVTFLYVAVRLLVRREPRLWLLLGLIAGIGLEAKYTIGFLILAFVVALLLTQRAPAAGERRGPGWALAIAAALLAPNLVWQAQHGWPSVHFFSSQNAKTASGTSRPAYLAEQLLFLGSTSVLAVAGVVWLWRRGLRTLALIPPSSRRSSCSSAGAATTRCRPTRSPSPRERSPPTAGWQPGADSLLLGAAVALQGAVIAFAGPIVVPFYSTRQLVSSSVWKVGYFKDEIGWPEMTAQVEQAWTARPPTRSARRRDPCPQLRGSLGAWVLRTRPACDPQRPPQLAVLAPGATPAALRPHGRLRRAWPRAPLQLAGGHSPTSTTAGISTTKNAAS